MCVQICKSIFRIFFHKNIVVKSITVSPPEAKDILGISCLAITWPVSRIVNAKLQLLIVRLMFEPACSIQGLSAIALKTFLSTYKNKKCYCQIDKWTTFCFIIIIYNKSIHYCSPDFQYEGFYGLSNATRKKIIFASYLFFTHLLIYITNYTTIHYHYTSLNTIY